MRVKLDGMGARDELDLGRNNWTALKHKARRYIVPEGREERLVWKERDGQLAHCVLEDEVERVLAGQRDGDRHFAAGVMR